MTSKFLYLTVQYHCSWQSFMFIFRKSWSCFQIIALKVLIFYDKPYASRPETSLTTRSEVPAYSPTSGQCWYYCTFWLKKMGLPPCIITIDDYQVARLESHFCVVVSYGFLSVFYQFCQNIAPNCSLCLFKDSYQHSCLNMNIIVERIFFSLM